MTSIDRRRVYLVDDHPLVLEGLARLLNQEPDLVVCGSAQTSSQALAEIQPENTDAVIADLSLKGESGFELIESLRTRVPNVPVLVLSMHEEASSAERALAAGARGYISKAHATPDIIGAVRQVLNGQTFVSQNLAHSSQSTVALSEGTPERVLSMRELEVFQLLGEGYKTRRIADVLRLSPKTVDSHCANIKSKLKLNDSASLVHRAVLWVHDKKR